MQAGSRRSDSFRREVAVKDWQTGHFAQDLPARAIFSRRHMRELRRDRYRVLTPMVSGSRRAVSLTQAAAQVTEGQ